MAKRIKEKLTWTDVNTNTMPAKLKKLYATYKAASKAAGEARTIFNSEFIKSMNGHVQPPEDLSDPAMVVGHSFGKLSFAWTERAKTRTDRAREFSF